VPAGLNYDFWLGQAPFKPYTENRCSADGYKKTWWFINDYSLGFLSGWGVHPLDIALWGAGDLAGGTIEADGHGSFPTEGACNTATVWEVEMKFGSGVTMTFVGLPNGGNAGQPTGQPAYHFDEWKNRYRRIEQHGTAFEGTDGWVLVDRGAIRTSPESLLEEKGDDYKVKLIRSSNHVRNLLDSIKSRKPAICPIEDTVQGDILCHLSDITTRLDRKLKWDPVKEKFIGDKEADSKLTLRKMRQPWGL
jgi:predicted dehydrogenase